MVSEQPVSFLQADMQLHRKLTPLVYQHIGLLAEIFDNGIRKMTFPRFFEASLFWKEKQKWDCQLYSRHLKMSDKTTEGNIASRRKALNYTVQKFTKQVFKDKKRVNSVPKRSPAEPSSFKNDNCKILYFTLLLKTIFSKINLGLYML